MTPIKLAQFILLIVIAFLCFEVYMKICNIEVKIYNTNKVVNEINSYCLE
jgi:hypothetical protein